MLSLYIINLYGVTFSTGINSEIMPFVINYSKHSIGSLNFIVYEKVTNNFIRTQFGCETETLRNIVSEAATFKYTEGQNDYRYLKEKGGNCQAFATFIYFKCKSNGLNATIVSTTTHMYNKVYLTDGCYIVDIPNNKVERVF